MMKLRITAVIAAVMIGAMLVPVMTAYAEDNAPAQDETTGAAAPSAAPEAESVSAIGDAVGIGSGEETEMLGLEEQVRSCLPITDTSAFTDILSDLDPEVAEVLLKNPKLLAYFLPTLHVTVTDRSVTIAVDGEVQEELPVVTGRVRTNGGNLNVRTGPGIEFKIINRLANGMDVTVVKEENGWYQLELPAEYGYVCGKYLEVNDITPRETPEGYSFDIDGEMLAEFLSMFSGLFEEEPVPEIHGLTPDGNLTLVDDLGPVTGEGQQFITLVTKAGNYFYLIIDRNEKGEETVHFLNMVDERDLFTLMEEEDQTAYQESLAAEHAAKEAAEKAAAEATEPDNGDEKTDKGKEDGAKTNMLPLLMIPLILAGAGGGWFYLQAKKKKKASAVPDPDADYAEDDDGDEEDYGAGGDNDDPEQDISEPDTDPYGDEIDTGAEEPEDDTEEL